MEMTAADYDRFAPFYDLEFGSYEDDLPLYRAFAAHAGDMATLLWRTFAYLFTGRIAWREVVNQIYWMGVGSIPIVLVTGTDTSVSRDRVWPLVSAVE